MGQSVSRVNDRSSVPGPLGHGMGERPMIGVGREGGHEEAPSPETAGVPHGEPHSVPLRRKQTLGEAHPKPQESIDHDHNKNEEQSGFRGRLHRGWQTTIGVFQRKHDSNVTLPTKKDNDNDATSDHDIPTTKSAPSSPKASSSSSPPNSPPTIRGRAMSMPARTSQSPVVSLSPVVRARSDSGRVPHPASSNNNDASPQHQQQAKPMTANELAAARAVAAMKGDKPTSHQHHQQQQQQHSNDVSNMSTWWRNHHPTLEHMMPPRYAPGNSQPDELHRESRDPTYQGANPQELHEPNSPSISQQQSQQQQRGYVKEETSHGQRGHHFGGLPPKISPWNTQPDEIHREPRWRSHSDGTGNVSIGTNNNGSNDGPSVASTKQSRGIIGSYGTDGRYSWPPGQMSLHNNDSHTVPGGWPMNP